MMISGVCSERLQKEDAIASRCCRPRFIGCHSAPGLTSQSSTHINEGLGPVEPTCPPAPLFPLESFSSEAMTYTRGGTQELRTPNFDPAFRRHFHNGIDRWHRQARLKANVLVTGRHEVQHASTTRPCVGHEYCNGPTTRCRLEIRGRRLGRTKGMRDIYKFEGMSRYLKRRPIRSEKPIPYQQTKQPTRTAPTTTQPPTCSSPRSS